jgi:hypothetical protein
MSWYAVNASRKSGQHCPTAPAEIVTADLVETICHRFDAIQFVLDIAHWLVETHPAAEQLYGKAILMLPGRFQNTPSDQIARRKLDFACAQPGGVRCKDLNDAIFGDRLTFFRDFGQRTRQIFSLDSTHSTARPAPARRLQRIGGSGFDFLMSIMGAFQGSRIGTLPNALAE